MAISPLFKELTDRYQNIDSVITYLSEIKKDLGETIKDLFVQTQSLEGISDSTKKQLLKDQYHSISMRPDFKARFRPSQTKGELSSLSASKIK
jgi:hypothetical protein